MTMFSECLAKVKDDNVQRVFSLKDDNVQRKVKDDNVQRVFSQGKR